MRSAFVLAGLLLVAFVLSSLPAFAVGRASGELEGQAAPSAPIGGAADDYPRRVDQTLALIERSAGIDAEPALAVILAEPGFKRLPKAKRYDVLIAAGRNAVRAGKLELGRDRLVGAVALDADQPYVWYLLAFTEADLGRGVEAASRLRHFAISWPELVNHVEARQLGYVAYLLERGSEGHIRLLQAFFDAGWNRSPASASSFWFQLALMHLEQGAVDAARAVAARVIHPTDIVSMRMDRRFAPLTAGKEDHWDPVVRGSQLLAMLRDRAADAPTDLEAQTELFEAMLVMGLHEEILERSEPILQAIDAGDPAYQGQPMQNWIRNHRALALLRLGRVEDGLAQMRLASEISEHGQVGNTSQVLNLAQLYGRLDRPQDALATLGRVDGMSDYGRMVQASVRHTASVRRGDAEAAAEALEFLREHRAKAPEQYLNALLFAEREDEAALAVVELLRSDSERSSTLRWLQDLKQPPVLKGEEPMRERWLRLRERQDVRTEVERWGSMGAYPIYAS